MQIGNILKESIVSLLLNKGRTFLTTLGIIIGIFSVIVMMAVGNGVSKSIKSSIESMGSNLLIIIPITNSNSPSSKIINFEDLTFLRNNLDNIRAITGEIMIGSKISYKNKDNYATIVGVDKDYHIVRNLSVEYGSEISSGDVFASNRVAIIGKTVFLNLFGDGVVSDIQKSDVIGQTIKIKDQQFTIIGVSESKGASGISDSDNQIFVPITTLSRYYTGNKNLSLISVSVADIDSIDSVSEDIDTILRDRYNIKDDIDLNFQTINQSEMIEQTSAILDTVTLFLSAIASISLLVGGIGIMNMMLTSVTERTREIGLRKAIGAKNSDIRIQFLLESVILTLIGGIIGVSLGVLITSVINKYFSDYITAVVTMDSVMLAFGVSSFIGIIFGFYPAYRASKLNPIDALRYE